MLRTVLSWTTVVLCCATMAAAQDAPADETDAVEEDLERVEETLVVTASRTEQRLQDAPAAMSVISAEELETAPSDDYGDLLRNVPGVNVTQISARDINITSRASTGSLATSQLVLVDNRSIYLDFFGFVIWEFLPSNPFEIKQIEVVRGPGSAVWGANALTGVINVITKSPREMDATSVTLGGGELGTAFGSVTHATAGDTSGFKISAAYYEQDPYDRPTGTVPGTGTPYPSFENQGTNQPKVDFRWDRDIDEASTFKVSAGYAATDGIIHTGIGPFDIQSDSALSYAQLAWTKNAKRMSFFVNDLDGVGDNLLAIDATGQPLRLGFSSRTFNLDYSDTKVVGEKNIVTFGATARSNDFDLSIAPLGTDRDEYGLFLQDEILISDKVRWLIGSRFDDIDPIGNVVSPRTSLMISPRPNHTLRFSFNRAFRSPSVINNFLDIVILNQVLLPTGPYVFPSRALGNSPELGNVGLQEERLDAIEVGYVGNLGNNVTLTLALYENETTQGIDFFTQSTYTGSNPPPGFPLPPFFLDIPQELGGLAGAFPAVFSYRNIGEQTNRGVEFSLNGDPSPEWSWFLNYSWQDEPDVVGVPFDEVGLAPENRFNLGLAYSGERYFWNANANYQDDAYWTDVLDSRFFGPTDSFTQFNVGLGMWLNDGETMFKIDAQNVTDEDVQQHVFGDIIGRKVTARVSFRF